MHTGAAEIRDDDYFGPPLNRVSRLLGTAHGGQVLLSQITADLVRDELTDGLMLLDLGEHVLRDIERPERISQLAGEGLVESFPPLRASTVRINNLPPRGQSSSPEKASSNDSVSCCCATVFLW